MILPVTNSIVKPPLGSVITPDFVGYKNLVGYWLMNEGAGNKVYDLSGNGHTGTRGGTGTIWVSGKFGPAQKFNGTADYVTVPFWIDDGSGDMSAITWLKTTSSSFGYLCAAYDGTNYVYFGRLNASAVGQFDFMVYIGGVFCGAQYISSLWRDGNWHQIVMTKQQGTPRIYVDGLLRVTGTQASQPAIAVQCDFDIGARNWVGSHGAFMAGEISSFSLYNRALSASEIAELYINPFRAIAERRARYDLCHVTAGMPSVKPAWYYQQLMAEAG